MSYINADVSTNIKDRIIDGIGSLVNTIGYFHDLFSTEAGELLYLN